MTDVVRMDYRWTPTTAHQVASYLHDAAYPDSNADAPFRAGFVLALELLLVVPEYATALAMEWLQANPTTENGDVVARARGEALARLFPVTSREAHS